MTEGMTTAQITQAAIWLDKVAEVAARYSQQYRAQLAAAADTQYRVEGVAPTWRLRDIATVSTSTDRDKVTVTDPAALLRWVTERHPEQVQQSVRPAYVDHLTKTCRRLDTDSTDVVNPDGEVVPGLTFRAGGGFRGVSIKPTATAADVFGALAEEALQAAALTAAPAIAPALTALMAAETPGELDPTEVPE